MRNLRIIGRSLLRFSNNDLPLTATAWDAASGSLICAFGPSESQAVVELKRLKQYNDKAENALESIASWDAPCPLPTLTCDKILNLHHFADSASSCLVLVGGDIVIVRESPLPGEDLIEIVGSVDAGISAAAWSPDEDLLAITTLAGTFLLMTREFENITSAQFSPDDVKVSNHVSVGWGKAETQFKGKRARALQDPTVPEHVDEGVLSLSDDRSVTISWRGDGAYLAINTVEEEKRRMIRVYSREGQLDSVSEPVDGLEGALSWRPSGNLIAGIRRSKTGGEVVFFERNGLRHGQFDLQLTPFELEDLSTPLTLGWNSDSSVLAVCYPDKTQLWTMGNYHYYLKQELTFPEKAIPAVRYDWNLERPLQLALSTPGAIQMVDLLFATNGGSTCSPNDYGLMGVIDGSQLKMTPLRIANVPPPMSSLKLEVQNKIVDAAISTSSARLAVATAKDITLYALNMKKRPVPPPSVLWRADVTPGHLPRHVSVTDNDLVYVLTDEWDEEVSTMWRYEEKEAVFLGQTNSMGKTSGLFTSIDQKVPYIQSKDGSIYAATSGTVASQGSLSLSIINKFPSFAPDVRTINLDEDTICFGLTSSGILYANGRTLVRNCTSFLVTPAHLLFTTTQHFLKFVHLAEVEDMEVPPDEPQKDERCRNVERGARLVTVMPTVYAVVLQMPRGNLETIYPRALVLASIRRSIEAKDYATAFFTCRSQRVDMNILHDHAPEQFMANIATFLAQVKKTDHIDLFLSQLRDEDVSVTMYKETIKGKREESTPSSKQALPPGSKVNRICDAFLEVLEKHRDKHLQNIITAHVCKVPPDLEAGLQVVGKLQEAKDPLVDRAAEHICFLADVNQLYDTSLGIYNLELALLIAQQSQKDPREYLPYLQSLQELPETRRKFQIDDQLGRRSKALSHLHTLEAHDELQAYAEKHTLYSEALELYKYQPDHLNTTMRLYATFLIQRNRFKDAGLAYEYLNDHAAASSAYRFANLWRESLSSAILSGMEAPDLESLAQDLAEGLQETKDYFAAGTIYLDHLNDVPTAAKILCKGHHFSDALRIVTLRQQTDLITSVIDPGLIEASGSMTEFLADCRSQLLAQIPRLRELRIKKAEDPLGFFDGGEEKDIPDNVSLAPTEASTSGGTFLTRYTNRSGTVATNTTRKTSKNRRREERKRARGKKGSVYEEEYLVNSVERLMERLNGVNEEVQRLVEGLVRRGMRERAAAVSMAMEDVVGICRESLVEVFRPGEEMVATEAGVFGVNGENTDGGHVLGGDRVLQESMQEMGRKRDVPVLKGFEKLSLLG